MLMVVVVAVVVIIDGGSFGEDVHASNTGHMQQA